MKVVVFTFIPSPYQVELFDAVARLGRFRLIVVYVAREDQGRPWKTPTLAHEGVFLEQASVARISESVAGASLAVFSWYRHPLLRRWMRERADLRRAWCYWGEAPGFRFRGTLAAMYRRWLLRPLATSDAPIWGVGRWAVDRYKKEFGSGRLYADIPYFSDLGRFASVAHEANGVPRRVLFSGSLIDRKGVDTLAQAWRGVVKHHPEATLHILGDGPLRPKLERILRPVAASVTFHGAVDWARVPEHYGNADLLCAPSRYDGWGLIVPEALAAGLPVIASRRMGAAVEMIEPGENGWLVDPGDSAGLEDGLHRALSLSSDEYRRIRERGRRVAEDFGLAAGATRFADAAHEAVSWFSSPRGPA